MSMRAILLCALFVFSHAAFAQTAAPPKLPASTLTIETTSGIHYFMVEMALSAAQRERGLMFRDDLGSNEGMLFTSGSDEKIAMWMKNTKLPLDMIFISADGIVAKIAENAEPQSLKVISSDMPVRAVLEVKAGTVRRLQIKPGNNVRNALFGTPVEDKKP